MPRKKLTATLFLCLAAAALGARPARASYVYETVAGATAGGQPVDATATITISNNLVHIDLTNLLNNPKSDIQTVNGIRFVLSTGQTTSTSLTGTALFRTISNNSPGGYTDMGAGPTTWNLNNNVSSGIEITSIGNPGAQPTLIGGPKGSNAYVAANGSIAGNGPHNPFITGTAMFDLAVPGVTAATTVVSVRFEFGTTAGTNLPGQLQPVPEPSSLALAGIGGLGLLGYARRRRRAVATP